MDYYDGTPSQLDVFRTVTGITYPLCRMASPTGRAYGVTNDWSVVVDQQGIIRYKQPGANVSAINTVIDQLLANTGVAGNHWPARNFVLHQNYPNPFNPATRITFELIKNLRVSLKIYNAHGQLVETLLDQNLGFGQHEVTWNAQDRSGRVAASGVYFYELRAGELSERKKMVLMQ
ncbi:MAG: T9SS type A sorting domain-containing protein [bacterium]